MNGKLNDRDAKCPFFAYHMKESVTCESLIPDTHAKIDYDVLNNQFYLIPANNRNTIYCNGSPVYAAQKLSAYDRLRLGDTEVLFVPFCCEHFTWSEGE